MKTKNFILTLLLTAMIFVPAHLSAQVTIGSDRAPSPWSLLDLDNSERVRNNEQPLGLHLPRLDEEARYDLDAEAAGTPAQGLMIFNTDNECLEFWSGTHWISLCEGDEPPFITPPHFNPLCRDNVAYAECFATLRRFNSTVRQLNDGTPRNFTHPTISAINFNMMPVTGGVFYMGAQDTNPAHPNFDDTGGWVWNNVVQVGVSSFYMSQTLVTAELFAAVMGANGTFHGQLLTPVTGLAAQWGTANANIPRNMVSWYEAVLFANRLSLILGRDAVYRTTGNVVFHSAPPAAGTVSQNLSVNGFRLPTEAEWEYAARGGQRNEYTRTLGASGMQFLWSGSNTSTAVSWHFGHSGLNQNQPVRGLAPNQLGLYDMSGLLWEWVWDWWGTFPCCSTNPVGHASGSFRLVRGGCWFTDAAFTRVSNRAAPTPGTRNDTLGFRLASSAVE